MNVSKTKISFKKIISWTLGLPAMLICFSELEDLSFWWVQALAIIVAIAILAWNGVFNKER